MSIMSYEGKVIRVKCVRSATRPIVETHTPSMTSSLTNQFNNSMIKKEKIRRIIIRVKNTQEIGLKKKRDFLAQEDDGGLAEKFSLLSFDEEKKKKKRKIVREQVVRNYITKNLTRFIKDEMNGTDAKLVIQKVLNYSDIKEDENRLNMPIEQLETLDFLTVDEKKDLEDDKKKIVVPLVGPSLQMYEQPMVLGRCCNSYMLQTKWNYFVKDNEDDLKKDSKIQVWSFRRDLQLCFALIVVEKADVVNELVEELVMCSIRR